MNQSELDNALTPLKKDLSERIDSRGMLQGIISKHIQMINRCIDQNVTISLIHATIFTENDVSFNHLKNLIYRARAKLAKSQQSTNNYQGGIPQENITEEKYTSTQNGNAFSSLVKKEQKPIHNSSSDQESANERLKQLLMQKRNEA